MKKVADARMEEAERQKRLTEQLVERQQLELEKEILVLERLKEKIAADRNRNEER